MTWSWTIHGDPVGKGRPRFTTQGGFPRAYTPARTAGWEGRAVETFRLGWDGPPRDGAFALEVVAVFPRPKRLMRAKDPEGRIPHTAKPDGDNIVKSVGDALEKAGFLRNDSQLVDVRICKVYAAKCEGPCVEVALTVHGVAVTDEPPVTVAHSRRRLQTRYTGDPPGVPATSIRATACWAPGCIDAPSRTSRGLCREHHKVWLQNGGNEWPLADSNAPPGSPLPMLDALSDVGVELHRRTHCSAYNGCLDWALARRWPGFSCAGCHGPARAVRDSELGAEKIAAT